MVHNGTSRAERVAWGQKNVNRQMRFYRNVGGSFQELTGFANPFHDVAFGMDVWSSCPTFVDLDKDDVLELVLGTEKGKLQYFKQQNGTFQRVEETPFADLSINSTIGWVGIVPRFVDWDGDGSMDLVITGTDKVHFFQRGVCKPSVSYCKSGVCNQQTSNCTCDAGAEGQDCSLCGNYYVREQGQCRPCPGHNELAGTCSRRGVCEDDADARNKRLAKNLTGFKVTSARGTGRCTCSRPFFGHGCKEGQCPAGERLDRHAKVDTATEKYLQWEVCALSHRETILRNVRLVLKALLRVECLKRRLKKLVAARNWKDLHSTEARPLEYGLWQRRACKLLALRKAEVKSRSLQLGVSLDYVFSRLEDICKEKSQQAEWRVDVWGRTTRSGFFVRVRNSGDAIDPESAWPTLPICDRPEDPNFHQVAAVLAYGPWALGKGLCCPRDGLADCSLVDALETEGNSAKATWFLSWVWNYKFTTVVKALARWWQRHRMVLGAADDAKGLYIWCNDERRLLVALVPQAEQAGFQQPVPNMQLVEFLRCQSSDLPLLAIDGSCLLTPAGQEDWQRASWGIAAADGPDFQGAVVGVEQTPHAGERFALLHVCLASHLAKKPVQILCDNRAVFLRRCFCVFFVALNLTDGQVIYIAFGITSAVWCLLEVLLCGFLLMERKWRGPLHWGYQHLCAVSSMRELIGQPMPLPRTGRQSLQKCKTYIRKRWHGLNARADRAANAAAKNWKAEFAKMQDLHSEAVAWSTHAFHLQVFVACQRSIPTTVILPELEAKASVQADADAIKERIQKEHQSFEYVNQTVEQALWCEVIKFMKRSQQEPEEIELSTETPQDLDLSTSSVPVSAPLSAEDSQPDEPRAKARRPVEEECGQCGAGAELVGTAHRQQQLQLGALPQQLQSVQDLLVQLEAREMAAAHEAPLPPSLKAWMRIWESSG
eukprot:s3921_g3.t1